MARAHPEVAQLLFAPQTDYAHSDLELRPLSRLDAPPAEVQAALRTWIAGLAAERCVAIAIDDVESVDAPSAAVLAILALDARKTRLAYAITTHDTAGDQAAASLAVIKEHARPMALQPLHVEQTGSLLCSVFGDVPNLQSTASAVHGLSAGRPRECMRLLQHLVDLGLITYASGAWRLPAEIDARVLPGTMQAALETQIEGLSPSGLLAAQALALPVLGHLTHAELQALIQAPPSTLVQVVEELRRAQLIAGGAGGYSLRDTGAVEVLLGRAGPRLVAELHDRLTVLYRASGDAQIAAVYHGLRGSEPLAAVDSLVQILRDEGSRAALIQDWVRVVGAETTAATIALAHEQAKSTQRPLRDRYPFWPALAITAAQGADVKYYHQIPTTWLELLECKSGLRDARDLTHVADAHARAEQAVARAEDRFSALPEEERILSPKAALRALLQYVSVGFSIGNRTKDLALLARLPALLKPLAPLDPMLDLMHRNAECAQLTSIGAHQASRQGLEDVLRSLETVQHEGDALLRRERIAVGLHLWVVEVLLGTEHGLQRRAHEFEHPDQRIWAHNIEKRAALHRGDWQAAESHRRQAELITLQHGGGGAFSTLEDDISLHALACDLTGVRAIRTRIQRLAESSPGWVPLSHLADAYYHELCGEPTRALEAIAALRQQQRGCEPQSRALFDAVVVEVSLLTARGEASAARERGEQAMAQCAQEQRLGPLRTIALAVALADAALGDVERARARIQSVIEQQIQLGVTGLLWGLSHEHLARLAVLEGDVEAFTAAAIVAGEAYRVEDNSMLAVRYRHLLEDAERAGMTGPLIGGRRGRGRSQAPASETLLAQFATFATRTSDAHELAREALTLLHGDAENGRSWLFLLTQTGFELAASSGPSDNVEPVIAYATAQLEVERGIGGWTLTTSGALHSSGNGNETLPESEANGDYRSLPLMALREGVDHLVGLLVFVEREINPAHTAALATGLAKWFIESGMCCPVALG